MAVLLLEPVVTVVLQISVQATEEIPTALVDTTPMAESAVTILTVAELVLGLVQELVSA